MMVFVRFYLWTFEQCEKKGFSRIHRILKKEVFWVYLVDTC
jgi:hypothetical protein